MRPARRAAAAALVAAIAFGVYASTLLPGQDLGDTASFQTIAARPDITPRQGYPLYFAVTGLFVRADPTNPARAANLGSAVEAALAVGLLVLVGTELGGTLVAGLVAAILYAASYTFWSQATIAEVYALHTLMACLCLAALLHWRRRPSTPRLALFFAVCALGFGNHLLMVLLLPAFTFFLLAHAPGGPRSILTPRVALLAAGIAAVCSLQYAWNFSSLLAWGDHAPFPDLLRTFWFDVTKSDWRENMVATVPTSIAGSRLAMYWFDLRQQFGAPGAAAAAAGALFLLRTDWRVGTTILAAFLANWTFAIGYNVGDVHVFFLPSHMFVALAAGCGAGWLWQSAGWHLAKRSPAGDPPQAVMAALAVLLLAYPAWRAWDTYPALDRSEDTSATRFFDELTRELTGDHEIIASDLGWQLDNGIDYYSAFTRPELNVLTTKDALLHFPFVVWDNAARGRDIVLTDGAAAMVRTAYGRLFPIEPDDRLPLAPFSERIGRTPAGTPYVMVVMEPDPRRPLDAADLRAAASRLGLASGVPQGRYVAVAGRFGSPPSFQRAALTPFRTRVTLDGHRVDIRVECWLPADTFRRMGFGQVVVGRRSVLTLDRGASFVALAPDGTASFTDWAGGLISPQRRHVIRHETVARGMVR